MSSSTKNIYDVLRKIDTGYISPPDGIYNDLIIEGNLTVNGGQTILNTLTTQLEDPIITLNSTGAGLGTEKSGIEIQRGVGNTNQRLIFDESDDKWKAGLEGSELNIPLSAVPLTLGSIPYADLKGNLTQNNSGLFYSGTNLGLGTASPSTKLHITDNPVPTGTQMTSFSNLSDASVYIRKLHTDAPNINTYGGNIFFGDNAGVSHLGSGISGVQTGTDEDQYGLAFFCHLPTTTNSTVQETMRINHSGNVGIGTASPSALLHVSNIGAGSLTPSTNVITATNTPQLSLVMGDTRNYDSAGNGYEFDRGCHWVFNADGRNRYTDTGTGAVLENLAGISMAYHNFGSYTADLHQGATNIKFYTTGPNLGNTARELTEKMRIQYNGNVGIGTASPNAKLNIAGTTVDNTIVDNSGHSLTGIYKALSFTNTGRAWYVGEGQKSAQTQNFSLLSSDTGTGNTPINHLSFDCLSNDLFLSGNQLITGNVGIGTTTPNSSAVLDLTSTTKGFLPPRTTSASITTPVAGLTIYDTGLNNITLYNGTSWVPIPKPNYFNVYYSNSSAENSTTSTPTAGTSYFRVGLGSTLFKGDSNLFNINGNFMSCKYVGATTTKNSQHTINISYLADITCITTWIVYKNATFTNEKITGGSIMFDSRARQSVASNDQNNISLSFMDNPTLNDTYHVGVLHSHSNNVVITPSTFNWMVHSY